MRRLKLLLTSLFILISIVIITAYFIPNIIKIIADYNYRPKINIYKLIIILIQLSILIYVAYRALKYLRINLSNRELKREMLNSNWIKIESKNYVFDLYKDENSSSYKVHTYKPKHGGVDVIHYLTNDEVKNYLSNGIDSLKLRFDDMDKNYSKYELKSWR
ncbi:hypothetical protein ACE939_04135 [Aquimarina sp. W85]|uniref:hypothetical protein n=1 Tax=Aquimarina rhodophyticola TaxID=3342246 RepID=UPI00366E8CB5